MKNNFTANNKGFVKIKKTSRKSYEAANKKKSANRTRKNNWAIAEYMLSE